MYGIRPNEIYRVLGTLKGVLKGMCIDGDLTLTEREELRVWCQSNSYFGDADSDFAAIFGQLNDLLSQEKITQDQVMAVYRSCRDMQKADSHQFYNPIVQATQELEGIIHGILCDTDLTYDEITGLKDWLDDRYEFMVHSWPYDDIVSVLKERASDSDVFANNCEWLFAYLSIYADTKSSQKLNSDELAELRNKHGIFDFYDTCPKILFKGRKFCFTGRMMGYERSELAELVESLGGIYSDKMTMDVNFLVIGSLGSPDWSFTNYGSKFLAAQKWKAKGKKVKIIREIDFIDAVTKKQK